MKWKSNLIRSVIPLTCTIAIVSQIAGSQVVIAADSYKSSSSGNGARTAAYVIGGGAIAYLALHSAFGGSKPAEPVVLPTPPPPPTPTPAPAVVTPPPAPAPVVPPPPPPAPAPEPVVAPPPAPVVIPPPPPPAPAPAPKPLPTPRQLRLEKEARALRLLSKQTPVKTDGVYKFNGNSYKTVEAYQNAVKARLEVVAKVLLTEYGVKI